MTNHLQQIKTQQDKLFSLEKKIEEITIKRQQLLDKEKETTYSRDLFEERMALGVELKTLQDETTHQKNKVFCLENEGKLTSISDKKGQTYIDVPDFREVNSNQITFEEDEILTAKQPPYIPYIDEDSFRQRGYIFDAIRLKEDSYLMAIKKQEEKIASFYTIVTLGQLVLIIDFYTTKAKAKLKKDAQDKNERQEKYWDNLSEEKRSRFLMQQGIYHSLPAKIKKELSKEDYEALDWQEREKIYKFYKRYGSKRITSVLGSKQMWTSFHQMYERFINPNATPPKPGYGNTEVFAYWYEFVDVINYKLNDIEIQRADLSEARKAAIETSFGESNTSDVLQKKYGILVKRQNGDKINPMEVGQIENAFVTVQKKFGNLKEICLKKNIKISHTGVKYVFASKAVGMYISDMGTIAVSDKFGDTQFKLTMAHELAHFIDNYIGELNEKRYATDNYESTAGKIAFEFRKNMNIPSSKQSKYTNATKECFARALEMYVGVETFGENTGVHYSDGVGVISEMKPFFASGNFVSKESYTNTIKPLIEQFFKENKDIFTYTIDIDQSEEPVPMGTETSSTDIKEINEAIAALELLFELENDELIKQNIEGTIDELRFSYLGGEKQTEIPIMDEETYLAINGAGRQDIGEPALHKNKGNNSDKTWSKLVNAQAEKDRALIEKRQQLREEYAQKVALGELRPPTRTEKLIATANGHEDNPSVQAARRILEKQGIDWKKEIMAKGGTIRRYNLPLNDDYEIIDSYYTGGIENNATTCDNCGKLITNIAEIKNSKGQVFDVGLDCAETLSNLKGLYNVKMDFQELKSIQAKIRKYEKENKKLDYKIYSNGNFFIEHDHMTVVNKDIDFSKKYLKKYLEKVSNPEKIGFSYTDKEINIPFEKSIAAHNKNLDSKFKVDGYDIHITIKPYHNSVTKEISGHDFYLEVEKQGKNIYSKRVTMYNNLANDINYAIRNYEFELYNNN